MFTQILVPVDMAEKEACTGALRIAADMARLYGAGATLVSVTGGLQARVSHSAKIYGQKLDAFAAEQGAAFGITFDTRVYDVPDPSVEVDRVLQGAIAEIGADLVVMASHQPGWIEHLVNSHGGRMASHAPISVFVVRETDG